MNSKIRAAGPMVALLALVSAIGTGACSNDLSSGGITADGGTANTDAAPVADAAPVTDAGSGGLGMALWLGTDFASTEVVAVAPAANGQSTNVAGRATLASADVVPSASSGRSFLLVRDKGVVKVLDPARPWVVQRDITLAPDAGNYSENPYDVAYVPSIARAFVARYANNGIAVLDPTTGAREANVDLTPLMAPGDTDGLVDLVQLIADPAANKVYGLVQRIDQFDFSGRCQPAKPLVTAIVPSTRTLTGPAVGGQAAIELQGSNPQQMVFDPASKKLFVVSVGCTEIVDGIYTRRGIEEVNLATGAVRWVIQANGYARLGSLLFASGSDGYVLEGSTWREWTAGSTSFGTRSFTGIAPLMVSPTKIFRLTATATDGGASWEIRLSTPSASSDTVVGASPWSAVRPDATYGVSGIFVPGAGGSSPQAVRAPSFAPEAMRRRAPSAR